MNPTIWPICSQALLMRRWLCTVKADGPDVYWAVFSGPSVCFWTLYSNQVCVNDIRQPQIIRLYKSNVGTLNKNKVLNTNTGQNKHLGINKFPHKYAFNKIKMQPNNNNKKINYT